MRRDARGMTLVELLIGLSVMAVLMAVLLPMGLTVYAHAAVEYEAVHLVGELRRMQAVSRTTATALYVLDQKSAGDRGPMLYFRADGYDISRPVEGTIRAHHMLPLVRIRRQNLTDRPAAFDGNGDIALDKSANMTVRIYAAGYEADAVHVVIDRAARIRIERGAP